MADTIPGNTSSTVVLEVGSTASGELETTSDSDWWKVSLAAGYGYQIWLRGQSSGFGTLPDPYLELYNSSGIFQLANDDYLLSDAYLNVMITGTGVGTFYLGAYGNGGSGTYTLTLWQDQLATTTTAATVVAGSIVEGRVGWEDDIADWYRIDLTANVDYQFDLIGSTGDGSAQGLTLADPYLFLRNSFGSTWLADDNSGLGLNARISYKPISSGTYYLDVEESGVNASGIYRLIVNSNPVETGSLIVGTPRTGTIDSNGDADLYAVSLTAGTTYTLSVVGNSLSDPYLELLNSSKAHIADNDGPDATDANPYLSYKPTTSGTYYLLVRESGNNATGSYTVSAATNAAPTLNTPAAISYTDTAADDSFQPVGGQLIGADSNAGDVLSYGISGVTPISGSASQTKTYGSLVVNTASGSYTFTPNDAAIEALKGSASQSFTVSVSDGKATTNATLTVNLTGANDAADFAGTLAASLNEDGTITAAGQLAITDRDSGDATITARTNSPTTYGYFDIAVDGSWNYRLANDAAHVQALKSGQTVTDQFAVTTAGGDTTNVVITIAGADDAPTFSVGPGKVTTAIGPSSDWGNGVTVQADGKILVNGYSRIASGSFSPTLVRYNSDGSLDTGFDGDGKMVWNYVSSYLPQVALQSDDGYEKILMVTYGQLRRFMPDGTLDTSFSVNGIGYAYRDVAVLANQKILTFDYSYLKRLEPDGGLDGTFAANVSQYQGGNITVLPDGKFLIAGDYVRRYLENGTADPTFTVYNPPFTSSATEAKLQSDGKIVLAEVWDWGFKLQRMHDNGGLDTTFGVGGNVTTQFGPGLQAGVWEGGKAVLVQPDDKILLAGYVTGDKTDYDLTVIRYTKDGSLDASFGDGGKLIIPFSRYPDTAHGLTLQPDGKILVSGYAHGNDSIDFTLARLNPDGSFDPTFGATNTLAGHTTYTEGAGAVVLDNNVRIYDAELTMAGNFAGAKLILERHGGANPDDLFAATGLLSRLVEGADLVFDGTVVGTVTRNSDGVLTLDFAQEASNARVDAVMQSIGYTNKSSSPPASVQIDWIFGDGNTGTQSVVGSSTVSIAAVDEQLASSYGTDLDDKVEGTVNPDRVYGLSGNDTLVDAGGDDIMDGGSGADQISGGPGHDTLIGGTGNDTLDGGVGTDQVDGGDGNDLLRRYSGQGNDTLTGGMGDDHFEFLLDPSWQSLDEAIQMNGGEGHDEFYFALGNAISATAVTASGGSGRDTYHLTRGLLVGNFDGYGQLGIPSVTITDFAPGYETDRLDVSLLLEISASGAGGYTSGNPFATGYFRLLSAGDGDHDTLLQWDRDGAGSHDSYQNIITLKDVEKNQLTFDNFFGGFAPDGTVAATESTVIWSFFTDHELSGSFKNERMEGDYFNDTLRGMGGNDTLNGWGGDDLLYGGLNNDSIVASLGNDTLDGGPGNDKLYGDADADLLFHGAGEGSDTIDGGAGNDEFRLHMGAGRTDTVTVTGGDGADLFLIDIDTTPNPGTLSVDSGAGSDEFRWSSGFGANPGLRVTGFQVGAGGDRIQLDELIDMSASGSNGYSGGNPFGLGYLQSVASDGNTLLQWDEDGPGTKTYKTVMELIGIAPTALTAENFGGLPSDGNPISGSNTIATYADDTLTGTAGDNTMFGLGGADRLDGGDGNDSVRGDSGHDTLLGGLGRDTLQGGMGNDSIDGDADDDLLIYHSGEGSDTLFGSSGNDTINIERGVFAGTAEHVVAAGGDGDDAFRLAIAGTWGDTTVELTGGSGQDAYEFDAAALGDPIALPGYRVADFAIGTSGDRIDIANLLELSSQGSNGYVGGNPFTQGYLQRTVGTGGDTLLQWDADGPGGTATYRTVLTLHGITPAQLTDDRFGRLLIGTAGPDPLTGGFGNDTILGLAGNDTLEGGEGDDSVDGGADDDLIIAGFGRGNDTLSGGAGNDTIKYISSHTAITVKLADGTAVGVEIGDDTVDSVENIIGGMGGDLLRGNAIGNRIDGFFGNDVIEGGLGRDTLTGGAGIDTFVFGSEPDIDLITDLTPGEVIRVTGASFSQAPTVGDGSAVLAHQVQIATTNDRTHLYIGTDAGAGADLHIEIAGSFGVNDFALAGERIQLKPGNATPSAAASTVQVASGTTSYSMVAGDFALTDAENDGVQSVTLASLPSHGHLEIRDDVDGVLKSITAVADTSVTRADLEAGRLVYVADSGINGAEYDSFGFRIGDLTSISLNTATLRIASLNHAPTLTNAIANQTTAEDAPFALTIAGNTFADTDAGDILQLAATRANGDPLPAWLQFAGASFSGTPDNAAVGELALKVTAQDDRGATTSANFTLTVTNTNDAPTLAVPSAPTINDGPADDFFAAVDGTLSGNDVDAGTTLVYGIAAGSDNGATVTKTGNHGSLTVTKASGAWSYAPNDAAIEALTSAASDSFAVTVADGSASATQTLVVNLAGANDVPVLPALEPLSFIDSAGNDSFATRSGTLVGSDRDGDSLRYGIQGKSIIGATLHTQPGAYGTLEVNVNTGAWNYIPNDAAIEALKGNAGEQFTVMVYDGIASLLQPLAIQIAGANDAPSGAVVMGGNTYLGQTLNAVTTSLDDAEGLGGFAYQWQTNTSGNWQAIPQATQATLLLTDALVGQQLRVQVSYTDVAGSAESVASAAATITSVPVGKTVDLLAYSWKTHALLADVNVSDGGTHSGNTANGTLSFTTVTEPALNLTASRAATGLEATTVNLQDAIAILKMIVGLEVNGPAKPLSPYQAYAADFDGSGTVNLSDAIGVLKHVVGLSAPNPHWEFFNETNPLTLANKLAPNAVPALGADLAAATSPVHVGLVGVLRGDVDGSYAGPAGTTTLAPDYFASNGLDLARFGIY